MAASVTHLHAAPRRDAKAPHTRRHRRDAPTASPEKTMPPPGPETYVFCCGPPPMVKSAIAKLEARGHAADQIFCF